MESLEADNLDVGSMEQLSFDNDIKPNINGNYTYFFTDYYQNVKNSVAYI